MVAATENYARQRLWQPGEAPLPEHAGRAYLLKDFGRGRPAIGLLSVDAILRDGIDQSAMSFPAVISDITKDRILDVVVPEGGEFAEFALSPSVFANHQETALLPMPIGQARNRDTGELQIAVEPGRQVVSRCFVARKGRWAQAAEDVFHLVVEGVLCGVSIGFNPIEGGVERLPDGGNRFTKWSLIEWSVVGTACNARCVVVRSYLERGRITGKRINPVLRKSLEPLAATRTAQANGWTPETKALDVQGGEEPVVNPQALAAADFVTFPRGVDATCTTCQFNENGICQHDSIKGQPVTDRNCCSYWDAPGTLRDWQEEQVSETKEAWKRAWELVHRHPEKTTEESDMSKKTRTPKAKDAMSESSGTAGGYTAPEDGADGAAPNVAEAIAAVMRKHEATAPEDGPHDAYHHEEKGIAYHHHSEAASEEHLKAVEQDLATVDGVSGVGRGTEPPSEKGFTKVYTKARDSGGAGWNNDRERRAAAARMSEDHDWEEYPNPKGGTPSRTKAEFDSAERERLAEDHDAEANGSFPIRNEEDLKNAIHDVGRAKDPAAARRHIASRAHDLGLDHLIPDNWNEKTGVKEPGKEDTHTREDSKMDRKARRKALAITRLTAKGKAYMAARKFLPPKRRSALEECVSRKIPKIAEDHPEMDDDQRVAVAYSMCGEKAFGDDDYEHKDDLEAADFEAPEEESHSDHPHGAQLASSVIDTLESGIQQLEPECREFFEDLLEEVRGWAKERYPDADFAGDEEVETPEQHTKEEEETDEALERYRNPPPKSNKVTRKRSLLLTLKSLGKKALDCIKAAADDMHEVGRLDGKSFTPRHAKRLVEHARNLDAIHGAASGMHEKDEDDGNGSKPGEAVPPAPDADMDTKSVQTLLRAFAAVEEGIKPINEKLNKLNDSHYSIMGKRCF